MKKSVSFNDLDFRQTLGQFATGVAVALVKDAQGQLHGITLNSLTSVSLEPPLVLFCLKTASTHYPFFQEARFFSLNILAAHQQDLAQKFAARGPKSWGNIALAIHPSGLPTLQGCAAHLHCALQCIIPGGDHEIFLCRVEGLSSDPTQKPLIFYQSRFYPVENFKS